jgi:hypothetical protein
MMDIGKPVTSFWSIKYHFVCFLGSWDVSVSKWLLFSTMWAIFGFFIARISYILMRLCQLCIRKTHLSLIFIVLDLWNNSLRVDMSLHSDISRSNQSLLLLFNSACLAEEQQIQNQIFCFSFAVLTMSTGPRPGKLCSNQ